MKISLIIIMAILIATPLIGQVSMLRVHQISVGGGQEWNAFLRPNNLIEEGEAIERQDLWDNGTFQSLSLTNSLRCVKDQHKFKLNLNGSLGIFQTEDNANRHSYTLGASYRVKYATKKYFEFAPEYFRKKRQGLNEDQGVLATPFSYTQFRAPLSFDFYLGDGAWVKTELGYLIKSYDRPSDEILRYRAPFFGFSVSKKWTMEGHISKLTFNSTSQWRKYTELDRVSIEEDPEFDNEDDDEQETDRFREGERNWSYYFNNLTYAFKASNKKLKAEIGLYSTFRSDVRAISNYLEVGPGISGTIQLGQLELSPGVRYSIRKYSRLAPGVGNNILLRYKYLRSRLKLAYPMGENVSLYGNYIMTHRDSNNPNLDRTAFREYFYAQGELGVRWKL